jgi:multisubunit Na+/H+ antiporter MnhB subunit
VFIALLVIGPGVGLAYAVLSLPTVSLGLTQAVNVHLMQSGVTNPVTAVLLNFRSYDTLLEMVVLLLALLGVWALGGAAHFREQAPAPVLDILARLLTPLLILVATYLLWVGAHAPGGAFQAGSVLGAAGVLLLLAGWRPRIALITLPLRLVLIIGPAAFVAMAWVTLLSEGQLLTYPVSYAGTLILVLETAATLSIGVTLAALFVGGQPQDEQRK